MEKIDDELRTFLTKYRGIVERYWDEETVSVSQARSLGQKYYK